MSDLKAIRLRSVSQIARKFDLLQNCFSDQTGNRSLYSIGYTKHFKFFPESWIFITCPITYTIQLIRIKNQIEKLRKVTKVLRFV